MNSGRSTRCERWSGEVLRRGARTRCQFGVWSGVEMHASVLGLTLLGSRSYFRGEALALR